MSTGTGMFWPDRDPNMSLKAKIERAADFYKRSTGNFPNVCRVHPTMYDNTPEVRFKGHTIRVVPYAPVLPGNLWVDIEG